MRLLEPRNMDEIELRQFGKEGKPLVMVPEDDFDIIMDTDFDSSILRDPMATGNKRIPKKTLNRLGDIKSTLINFSRGPDLP